MRKKQPYVALNIFPATKLRVKRHAKIKTHKLKHGEHSTESVDSIINRALDALEEKQ